MPPGIPEVLGEALEVGPSVVRGLAALLRLASQ